MAQLEPEYAVRKLLLDDSDVSTLIGTRIYPLFSVPQSAKRPYITYFRSSDDHTYHLTGESGLIVADIEFDVFADTDAQMRQLADKFRLAVAGYRGTVTVGSDTCTVQMLHIKNTYDGTDPPPDGGSTPLFQRVINLKIGYNVTPNT